MSDKQEVISCEEAQKLANLVFAGLGKNVVRPPYFTHLENCESCRKKHEARKSYWEEYGEMMADAW